MVIVNKADDLFRSTDMEDKIGSLLSETHNTTFQIVDTRQKDDIFSISIDSSDHLVASDINPLSITDEEGLKADSVTQSSAKKRHNKEQLWQQVNNKKTTSSHLLSSVGSFIIDDLTTKAIEEGGQQLSTPFSTGENYALEAIGETTRNSSYAASRIKQIVDAARRYSNKAQVKNTTVVSSSGVTATVATAGSASSGLALLIPIVIVLIYLAIMTVAVLLLAVVVVISASSLAASASNNFYWPLEHNRHISSPYGPRDSFIANGTMTSDFHTGIDIPAELGTAIGASCTGTVTIAVLSDSGYGNYVHILHANGYETRYAHMSEVYVEAGQDVYATQIIGSVGSTGTSTGNHLHFELWFEGVQIDPLTIEYLNWDEVIGVFNSD